VFQDRSYQLQKMNEEIVLLREVYSSLYKEEIKLKIDEEKLMRLRQENAREYVQNHVENMERLFRQRIEMLQDQENSILGAPPAANNEMLESVIQRIGQQQRSLLEKERATVQQERDRGLMWRRESYQDLLSLLGAEKWSENLRHYSAAGVSVSPIECRVNETVELLNSRTNMPPSSPLRPFKSHPVLPPPKTPVPGSVYGLRVVRRSSSSSKTSSAKKGGKGNCRPLRNSGELHQQSRTISSHTATTSERLRQEARFMEEAFAMPKPTSGSYMKSPEEINAKHWGQRLSPNRAATTSALMAGKKRGGSAAVMGSPNNRKGSRVTY
jgi:hypothetical protein